MNKAKYHLHIGIDYSGREAPVSRTPALQVYAGFDTEEPRRILSPSSTDKTYKSVDSRNHVEWMNKDWEGFMMQYTSVVVLAFVLTVSALLADDKDRTLFSFDKAEAAKSWQTVNDGVMGGRSVGRFKINADKKLEFFGTLSLENNGGLPRAVPLSLFTSRLARRCRDEDLRW